MNPGADAVCKTYDPASLKPAAGFRPESRTFVPCGLVVPPAARGGVRHLTQWKQARQRPREGEAFLRTPSPGHDASFEIATLEEACLLPHSPTTASPRDG